jgi:hypothetical protein
MSYTLIERRELTEAASSISFENIPQFYSDLYILVSSRSDGAFTSSELDINFNGSSSDFSGRYLYGSGSGVGSTTDTTMIASSSAANNTANTFGNASIYIPNYTSSTAKSISGDGVGESNATTAYASIHAALWNQTAPITSITFKMDSGARNFVAGSTISLYGINRQQAIGRPKAVGGAITFANGYWVHTFNASGTFYALENLEANVLVVAGGASGARFDANGAGGGGAGGLLEGSMSLAREASYPVVIGAGGALRSSPMDGADGSNSSFNNAVALGGGGGGQNVGRSGGSGGGGGNNSNGGAATQGNSGGLTGFGGAGRNDNSGGGAAGSGGGASAQTPPLGPTSIGAPGRINSISGNSIAYAAGGGVNYGYNLPAGVSGASNTGNGGMGMYQANSGAGGSGIAIIRYLAD